MILLHPVNCLTYGAPALWLQVAPVIFDWFFNFSFCLFFFFFIIQASCCWKWYYRCTITSGPAAEGGPGGFDGTAASCGVPVQHAPPPFRGRVCSPVWPPGERSAVVGELRRTLWCLYFMSALIKTFKSPLREVRRSLQAINTSETADFCLFSCFGALNSLIKHSPIYLLLVWVSAMSGGRIQILYLCKSSCNVKVLYNKKSTEKSQLNASELPLSGLNYHIL